MHHRHDVKMAIEDTWPKEKKRKRKVTRRMEVKWKNTFVILDKSVLIRSKIV